MSRSTQNAALLAGTVILLSLAGAAGWYFRGDALIAAAYRGESLALVNKYVDIHRSMDPAGRDLAYFLAKGKPVVYRLCAMFTLLAVSGFLMWRNARAQIRAFFREPGSPYSLAVFRIAIFAAIIGFTDPALIIRFSEFPEILRRPPPGWGWFFAVLPIHPGLATGAVYALLFFALLALLGLFTRFSAAMTVLLGIYALGIPQFYGKIDHYHHLLWFAAIVAASPAGDVLSLDALRKRRTPPPPPDVRYALPLRLAWLLIGIMYFFPGFWKLVIGGTDWALSENMKYLIYTRWLQLDWLPPLRFDHYPLLYKPAGLAVIVFELAFIFLLFFPRWRKWAIAAGILFHISIYLTMRINFWTLLVAYVAFVDFGKIAAFFEKKPPPMVTHQGKQGLKTVWWVGASLLIVNTVCGFTLFDSWPVAVYPTFATVEEPCTQSITFAVETAAGQTVETALWARKELVAYIRPPRLTGLVWRVHWTRDEALKKARAAALIQVIQRFDPLFREARQIRIYEDIVAVTPEQWGSPPRQRRLLGEIKPPRP